jgi:hypothetical protein
VGNLGGDVAIAQEDLAAGLVGENLQPEVGSVGILRLRDRGKEILVKKCERIGTLREIEGSDAGERHVGVAQLGVDLDDGIEQAGSLQKAELERGPTEERPARPNP